MSTDNTPTTEAEKILICRMCEQDPLGGMALSAGECVGLLRAYVAAEVARATAELREQYDGCDAQIAQFVGERDLYAKSYVEQKVRAHKAEAEQAELREDKARLDWLEQHRAGFTRAFIDSARKAAP